IWAVHAHLPIRNPDRATLLKLMERNTMASSSPSQLLSQERPAKRTPASYVLGSPEIAELSDLKDKVLEAYKGTRKSLDTFTYLQATEKKEVVEFLATVVIQVSTLMAQGAKVSSTPELMDSADRLSALSTINEKMTKVLEEVVLLNNALVQKNEHRKAMYSMIKID
ncbi:MAG: hypothetical protein AB3N10_01070, partial [Allomuricauda sp.]